MRRRSISLIAVALTCAAFAPRAANAAVTVLVASNGDRQAHSFTTPVVVTQAKGTLTLLNLDLSVPHQVISLESGPDTQPWCPHFAAGHCPLLWSPPAEPGITQQSVRGMENTTSGATYTLVDPTDPSTPQMSATLVTV